MTEFGFVGFNQFAYCINNPVRYHDVRGYMPEEDCVSDDPEEILFPDKDALGAPTNTGTSSSSGNQGGGAQSPGGTAIYRYGYTSADKLVPTQNDVNTNTGLSFSTRYKPGAAMTTIEAVNSTGLLSAVQDKKSHVSVYPIGGTIYDWHIAGSNSIWTQTLIGIVAMS